MTATAQQVYEVRGGAARIFSCKAKEVLVEGPTRTGKTRALLEKAYAVALKYPGARIMLVRKTRAAMSESVLQTLEDDVLPRGAAWVRNTKRSHRDSYELPNGSIIIPRGLDQADKLMSMQFDRIFGFEWTEHGITVREHEYLLTRMSGKATGFQQMMVDCNPQHPGHWLNQRFNHCDGVKTERIHSGHRDNPLLWDEHRGDWTDLGRQYMETMSALTGVRRLRLLDGKWAQADGIVYPEFDANTHVIDAMPAGWQAWRKYRAIDFGYNDPFVCLWLADSGEALYVYRELYMSGRLVEDHARHIVELSKGEQYAATVADHDREDRETLARHGVQTTPAIKAIDRGIDAVRSRLRIGPNGKPGLYYLASAAVEYDRKLADAKRPTSLRDEFDSYIWAVRSGGLQKETPVDADNHGMDALRYAVMALSSGFGGSFVGVASWDDL